MLLNGDHNLIVCGSNKHSQLALTTSQLDNLKQLGLLSESQQQQQSSIFDYVPIDVKKLMKSNDEEITSVCIGLTFTLYLSSYSRVYCCCGDEEIRSLFDRSTFTILYDQVPNFKWIHFFEEILIVDGIFVNEIYCGASHCVFFMSSNELYVCGSNEYGQCGQPKQLLRITIPILITMKSFIHDDLEQLEEESNIINQYSANGSEGSGSGSGRKRKRIIQSNDYDYYHDDDQQEQQESTNTTTTTTTQYCSSITTTTQYCSSVIKVKCSYDYTVIQTIDGSVFGSGDNEYNQITCSDNSSDNKVFGFRPIYFKNLIEYENINDIITMDSYILALTKSGHLFINEGNRTFSDIGLDIDYFHNNPNNLIVNIFATSFTIFIRTAAGEVYTIEQQQQGGFKMMINNQLSFTNFKPSAGRYHFVSISTNIIDYGLFKVMGYNKYGNLGIKTMEETVKEIIVIPKVSDWIQDLFVEHFEYKIATNFFNTIIYRIKRLDLVANQRFKKLLFSCIIFTTSSEKESESYKQNIHNPFLEMFGEYSKRLISTRNFNDISIATTTT